MGAVMVFADEWRGSPVPGGALKPIGTVAAFGKAGRVSPVPGGEFRRTGAVAGFDTSSVGPEPGRPRNVILTVSFFSGTALSLRAAVRRSEMNTRSASRLKATIAPSGSTEIAPPIGAAVFVAQTRAAFRSSDENIRSPCALNPA